MLTVGQVVDRWVVEAVLGEGGMAIVYRVRHASLRTPAALKVLTIHHSSVRKRFLDEGRIQASLHHPHILTVHDVVRIGEIPALLLEYVDGASLADWLKTHRPTLDEAEALFRGIVAGVAHAHAQGLVHRDLKPANILLARDGDRLIPKVADFGLAKLQGDDGGAGRTRAGVAMGTPEYMAPEQSRNAKGVDVRADVFSLGCILYDLVTGHQAFGGEDPVDVMSRVIGGEYTRPEALVPELPERFRRTIRGCLEIDRDRRIADCAQLLDTLSGAPGPNPGPAAGRSTTVPLTAALAAIAIGAMGGAGSLVVVGGALAAWWSAAPAEPATAIASVDAPAEPPPSVAPAGPTAPAPAPRDEPAAARSVPELEPEPADPQPPASTGACPSGEGLVGWARAQPFMYERGDIWTLISAKELYADRPRADNGWDTTHPVVCTLPRGTRVRLVEQPIFVRGAGTWIAVHGRAIEGSTPSPLRVEIRVP